VRARAQGGAPSLIAEFVNAASHWLSDVQLDSFVFQIIVWFGMPDKSRTVLDKTLLKASRVRRRNNRARLKQQAEEVFAGDDVSHSEHVAAELLGWGVPKLSCHVQHTGDEGGVGVNRELRKERSILFHDNCSMFLARRAELVALHEVAFTPSKNAMKRESWEVPEV
jgi:hypothetical protein